MVEKAHISCIKIDRIQKGSNSQSLKRNLTTKVLLHNSEFKKQIKLFLTQQSLILRIICVTQWIKHLIVACLWSNRLQTLSRYMQQWYWYRKLQVDHRKVLEAAFVISRVLTQLAGVGWINFMSYSIICVQFWLGILYLWCLLCIICPRETKDYLGFYSCSC